MSLRRHLHQVLLLVLGLFASPAISNGQVFQISLSADPAWRCYDDWNVDFTLTVVDPTYPIIINWNNGAQIYTAYDNDDYQEFRYFQMVATYNAETLIASVVVTNGTGEVKNGQAMSAVIEDPGMDSHIEHYPYQPGDPVRGTMYMSSSYSVDLTVGAWLPYQWLSLTCDPQWIEPPGYCVGTWETHAPPGTFIEATGFNGCSYGPGWVDLVVGPPTVLPEWMVLDVQGSCANAPTGNITLAASDVVSGPWPPSSATIHVRRASNNALVAQWTPIQPGGVATVGPFEPDLYWVKLVASLYVGSDSVLVEVPSLGGTCGMLRGRAFVDGNENCTFQTTEVRVPQAIVEILPGPIYVTTPYPSFADFNINQALPVGSYTMTLSHPVVEEHCTGGPIPFSITGSATPVTVDVPTLPTVPLDMSIHLSSDLARPGFVHSMSVAAKNWTPANSGAGTTVTLEYDPLLSFLGASPPPTSSSGNTLTWVYNNVAGWQMRTANVSFEVPPDVALIGTDLISTATVVTGNTDSDLSNNTTVHVRTITGAYDPNDKLAWTSSGSDTWWLPGEDQWIDYTIRFQNSGTDTAFNVLITDTLPAALDPASIVVGAASHTFHWMLKDAGILKFGFPGILLPDSNVNEPASHGFVTFRIKVREGFMLDPGDEVVNMANIYFDFNPPIITPPCVLTVPYPEEQVLLDARVFLSGVYDTDSGLMRDDLRAQGLVPTSEPYSALGHAFEGGGGETVSPAVLAQTGPTAVVDWVVVELRPAVAPHVVAYSRAALLRRDGRVVDVDGTSPVAITAVSSSYLVSLRHRNHLGVLFDLDLFFQPAESEDATEVDFTDPSAQVFGVDAQQDMGDVMALWPGDVDFSGSVKYAGANNDRDAVLLRVGGSTPTNVVNGYFGEDVNMDGDVKYTGADNDRDIILQNIGGVVPTAVRVEQLP